MNNNKPHNHLSKEELLEMLSNKTGSASDFDALDDFEKDAFEGFSAHSNANNAKNLMDELELEISRKISSTAIQTKEEDDTKKKPYAWLALAASLALIIGLSVLFFTNKTIDTEQNMAFNEKAKQKMDFEKAPVATATDQAEAETNNNLEETTSLKASHKSKKATNELQTQEIEHKENNHFESKDAIATKHNNDQTIKSLSQTTTPSEGPNTAVVLREEALADAEENVKLTESVAATQPVTSGYSKYDFDDNASAKTTDNKKLEKVVAKSEAKKTVTTSNAPVSITEAVTIAEISASVASYKGGQKAIEKYVLNYEKEHVGTHKLMGKYNITATVKTNGQLVVLSVTGNDVFKSFVKEALNTMKTWKPSTTKNGTALESSIEFELDF